MKKEKAAENLEKQGRGLTIFLKILGVILLLLNLILLDQEFVPWGEDWEEIKLVFFDEDTTGMTDKELWAIAKDTLVEEGDVPIKSGFLCWARVLFAWNEYKAEKAEREKVLRQASENAETVMAVVNEFLSENGIKTDSLVTAYIYFHDKRAQLACWDNGGNAFTEDEDEKLKELLLEAVPLTEKAAAKAYILGSKCTAAAFAFKADDVIEGTDFPWIDENGHFDTEHDWGYGWSAAENSGNLIGFVNEIVLEDKE